MANPRKGAKKATGTKKKRDPQVDVGQVDSSVSVDNPDVLQLKDGRLNVKGLLQAAKNSSLTGAEAKKEYEAATEKSHDGLRDAEFFAEQFYEGDKHRYEILRLLH